MPIEPVIVPDVLTNSLKSLDLSAAEIRQMTDWPTAMVEEFLSILNNLSLIAAVVDVKNNIVKKVTRVTFADSPYEIKEKDEEVFFDTDDGDIIANLRPGDEGRNYRLINVGKSGNKVYINPYGTELLFGENVAEYMADQEALIITYDEIEGWN
jgi:hypothetical protein